MNIDHLKTFLHVAHLGSFAAAARARDQDPSSVSRTVAQLETELGVRLFQRSTRHMELTEAGTRYRDRIVPVIDEMARAQEEATELHSVPAGLLKVSASVAFGQHCLVPLIREFQEAYPNLDLELVLSDENVDLIASGIDLSVRLGPSVNADLITTKLMQTRYRVVASPNWQSRHMLGDDPNRLSELPCLRFSLPEYRERWMFRTTEGNITTVPVTGPIVISSALALREAALAGFGPALLADWLINRDIAEGTLVDLFPEHDAAATSFDTGAWLIYPSRAFLPRKVRAAIDFLKSRFPVSGIAASR